MKSLLLFLDIVQLTCGSQLATGTLVKTARGPELWTVQHFIEGCRSEGSFAIRSAQGDRATMRIDAGRLQGAIYQAPLKKFAERHHASKSIPPALQCRMLSRRLIPDENQRREQADKLRNLLQKAEAMRQQAATAPAALLFLNRALEHGYSTWLEADVRHAFLQELPAPGELQANLITQAGTSEARLWSDDIYTVTSRVQDLRATPEGYTADCDGWYGSSGGALVDGKNQVLGLIEGSQDQLASVFNGIAAVGRLRIHKIGELP